MKSFVAPSMVAETLKGLAAPVSDSLAVSGTVYDIQRFSINDGPGIRTIVFFKGCPLRCLWCSNPESQRGMPELLYSEARCIRCGECVPACPDLALALAENGVTVSRARCSACEKCSAVCPSSALRISGKRMNIAEVLNTVARDDIFYKHSRGGMTLSGGEPLTQPDFALGLLRGARARGIPTAIETTGYASAEVVERVLGAADLILYDIKHMNPAKHLWGTGVRNERILDNARLAASLGVRMIIRAPVIPEFNDAPEDVLAIGRFTQELGLGELHLLPYHRFGVPKYAALQREYPLPDTPLPSDEEIESLRCSLQALGLQVRIGG